MTWNPYRGTVMAHVSAGSRADAARAVDAAPVAFPGWKQALFLRAADIDPRYHDRRAKLVRAEESW
jgi:acyl-CoA reductase-like NAD-dependent aldehyde dehydrogenase